MVALCGRKSPILKRASPERQIFLTLDSGPANLVDFREFTCLPWLQPLEGLKDGAHPGLLCSPASASGKEQRALCSLAHPQLGAGQGTRPHERLTRPRACPAVRTALLWAPAPRWRGAPRPWLWAPPGSCLGRGGGQNPPRVIIYCRPACSGTKGSPGPPGGEGKVDSWINSR